MARERRDRHRRRPTPRHVHSAPPTIAPARIGRFGEDRVGGDVAEPGETRHRPRPRSRPASSGSTRPRQKSSSPGIDDARVSTQTDGSSGPPRTARRRRSPTSANEGIRTRTATPRTRGSRAYRATPERGADRRATARSRRSRDAERARQAIPRIANVTEVAGQKRHAAARDQPPRRDLEEEPGHDRPRRITTSRAPKVVSRNRVFTATSAVNAVTTAR